MKKTFFDVRGFKVIAGKDRVYDVNGLLRN